MSDRRLARTRAIVPPGVLARDGLTGEEVIEGILWAYAFAAVDPYRATTHNKGILNGIDPVLIASGNDWRAVEAGAHAYAARSGQYTSSARDYPHNNKEGGTASFTRPATQWRGLGEGAVLPRKLPY